MFLIATPPLYSSQLTAASTVITQTKYLSCVIKTL